MATVPQYLAWAERRIAKVVTQEGLHLGVMKVVQGPLTLTFCVRLLQPTPATLRRVLGLGPTLAQALQVESVRVSDSAAGILLEIPSPVQRTPSAEMLASHTQGLTVAVGLDQFRRPVRVVYWSPKTRPHAKIPKTAMWGEEDDKAKRVHREVQVSSCVGSDERDANDQRDSGST